MSGRATVNTILPGKLYQRSSFLSWPRSQKERLLKDLGVTVVVNMWSKVDPDLGWEQDIDRFYIQWHTSPSAVPTDAEPTLRFLANLMENGHVLLVHCEAGRARSVWLATWLVALYCNIEPEAALEIVNQNVKDSLRPVLLEDLGVRRTRG